jgi:hypothetical protein
MDSKQLFNPVFGDHKNMSCVCVSLQESGYQDGGSEGFGYSSSSSYAAPTVSHVTASQVSTLRHYRQQMAAAGAVLALQTEVARCGARQILCGGNTEERVSACTGSVPGSPPPQQL